MRRNLLGLLAILLAPVALPAAAETTDAATVQMREDEAFWNAIRDSDDPAAFRLFIQAHPESPYVAEAKARIEELEAQPSTEVVVAAPTEAIVPAEGVSEAETETAAPVSADPAPRDHAAVPTLEELVAALDLLGAYSRLDAGDVPDPQMIESYLGAYRRSSGRSSSDDVTDAELREVMYFAENRDMLLIGGYDASIIEELLYRMTMVHEKAYGQPAPEDMTELVTALQKHLNLPKTGLLSEQFLYTLASEPVPFPSDELYDRNQIIGDWVLQENPASANLPRRCYLFPRSDRVSWDGPMLSWDSPAAPNFYYTEGSGSLLSFWVAPEDVFSVDYGVRMVAGNAEMPLVLQFDEFDYPLGWTEERNAEGYYTGADIAMLKNASGEVRIEGTSPFGIPLTITVSAIGFTKAFRTMSQECSGGELDVWLQ